MRTFEVRFFLKKSLADDCGAEYTGVYTGVYLTVLAKDAFAAFHIAVDRLSGKLDSHVLYSFECNEIV